MEPPEDAGKMGTSGKYLRKVGSGYKNGGEVICGSGASGDPVCIRDVGPVPPVGEGPRVVSLLVLEKIGRASIGPYLC